METTPSRKQLTHERIVDTAARTLRSSGFYGVGVADIMKAAAEKEVRRTLSSANEEAESILRDARATAERIRLDSERELAAATQRRDSINAQLVNVRQMLATLSGGGSGLVDLPIDVPAEAPAQE